MKEGSVLECYLFIYLKLENVVDKITLQKIN